MFGYGTTGPHVTSVAAINDGDYGISRFVSSGTLFADDTAIGNDEAGFYVGDSPQAATVVRDNQTFGNQFGIFVRHARGVLVTGNSVNGNCQGILVLDDGQAGGSHVWPSTPFGRQSELAPDRLFSRHSGPLYPRYAWRVRMRQPLRSFYDSCRTHTRRTCAGHQPQGGP